MVKNVLLLGRKGIVVENVAENLEIEGIRLFGGRNISDVREAFSKEKIDTVIMGAGIDIEARLEIIRLVFSLSNATTVHMKDWDSGPAGMLPFVKAVLTGLAKKNT